MTDIKTPEERSRNMSKIRSKDTKPEVWLRKQLFASGYRYRKNVSNILGHPDLWLAKYNTAIFVHGCFWHRHEGCKYAYTPKTRTTFWKAKFLQNVNRDKNVYKELSDQKIKYVVIWECTVKKMMKNNEYKNEVLRDIYRFFERGNGHIEK